MPDDQLGVDMWRNAHFVCECTVKTATADVSPYEKHALSQNSLSSSQSHALLMIRREKDSVAPSVTAGSPCVCVCMRVCYTVQKLTGGFEMIPIRSKKNQHREDRGYAAATGPLASCALLSSWQQSLTGCHLKLPVWSLLLVAFCA